MRKYVTGIRARGRRVMVEYGAVVFLFYRIHQTISIEIDIATQLLDSETIVQIILSFLRVTDHLIADYKN